MDDADPRRRWHEGPAFRLSLMMFLEFAILGTWRIILSRHMAGLGFSGAQIGYVFSTSAIGAMVSPVIAGWVVDRFVPVQVFLGWSHLIGAGLLFLAWRQTTFPGLFAMMGAYTIVAIPTLALSNTIVLRNIEDRRRFGIIRVWGTLGWVFISVAVSVYLRFWEAATPGRSRIGDALLAGAALSGVLGLFSFRLPPTPPLRAGRSPYGFLKELGSMMRGDFAVLLIVTFVGATQVPIFYNLGMLFLTEPGRGLGMAESGANLLLTVGQVSEIAVMLLLASSLRRWGIRRTIFLGFLAWAVRFSLFAVGRSIGAIVLAQLLHGFCYTFVVIGGTIAVDRLSRPDLRASGQGLYVFATAGLGMFLGNLLSGWVYDFFEMPGGGHLWGAIFTVPIAVTLLCAIGFLVRFRDSAGTA